MCVHGCASLIHTSIAGDIEGQTLIDVHLSMPGESAIDVPGAAQGRHTTHVLQQRQWQHHISRIGCRLVSRHAMAQKDMLWHSAQQSVH